MGFQVRNILSLLSRLTAETVCSESRVLNSSLKHGIWKGRKKKKRTPEWRKRTVGLRHPISSAKGMLQHTLVIHSLLWKPPLCSIWTAEVISHKVKYQKELPKVNPKTYIGKQTILGGEQDPAGSNSAVHRRVSLYRDTTTASH